MKIGITFHTHDKYISGVEYYTLGLIRGLLRIDRENEYVVITNQPNLVNKHVGQAANLTIHRFGHSKSRIWRVFWEHFILPRIARAEALDILHCPHYICPCFGSNVPYVVTIHDTIAMDKPGWCKVSNAINYNIFMRNTVRKAARIISVSHCTTADIKRRFPFSGSRIRTVYPGIDDIFRTNKSSERQKEVRTRYKLPDRYYLFVGNLEPKKNIKVLLSVAAKARQQGLQHKLVIVGRRSWRMGSEINELTRQVNKNNILVTGYVGRDDLPYVYNMAEFLLFPSLYEGFGFPPLEAMASGTAVLSSRKGALAETLSDAAPFIDTEDISQIVREMTSIISNSAVRTGYVQSGKERSLQFDWDTAASRTLAVYREVLETSS